VVGQLVDVAEDDLHLELLSLGQCLPPLEDGLDPVLGQIIPRDVGELAAPGEELAQKELETCLRTFRGSNGLAITDGSSLPQVFVVPREAERPRGRQWPPGSSRPAGQIN
jgi:hypothetical protein